MQLSIRSLFTLLLLFTTVLALNERPARQVKNHPARIRQVKKRQSVSASTNLGSLPHVSSLYSSTATTSTSLPASGVHVSSQYSSPSVTSAKPTTTTPSVAPSSAGSLSKRPGSVQGNGNSVGPTALPSGSIVSNASAATASAASATASVATATGAAAPVAKPTGGAWAAVVLGAVGAGMGLIV